MKIVAIKDESAGNETVGEMWQETKIFDHTATLLDVLQWVGTHKKRVTLTIPHDSMDEWYEGWNHGKP